MKDKARENAQGKSPNKGPDEGKGLEKAKDKVRESQRPRSVESGPSRFAGIQRFVRETRSELRKVVWPTRETAINLTTIVVIVSGAVALFLGGVDFVFKWLFQLLLGG